MIGPSIPEHLSKQKEKNQDEISISDSDDQDDDQGIGPMIPKHLLQQKQQRNQDEIQISDDDATTPPPESADDADAFAPVLPPELLQERRERAQQGPRRRVMGPAMPPPPGAATHRPAEGEDDMVGPSLPANYNAHEAALTSTIADIEARARQSDPTNSKAKESKGVERPEWMMVPPDVNYLADATSGRARSFNARSVDKNRDTSSWTDTPADKERKAREAAQGNSSSSSRKSDYGRPSANELATREKIQRHNETERPMSLLEMHRKGKYKRKNDNRDDPTKRAFDRDKDLAGARPMNKKQKSELLKKSGEWADRFGPGRGSSFL
ncbi:hypothetical protein DM01DRAFT_1380299 [Hesseltinella vesiculosa]|uniref:DUF3752 domain-containing protein n=1 Tax=Hesseltinella vesiculosa TaxID=101127 RepID=A0A1X2GTP0_9FUNG|nr:hypothetical protein DM01DRAFT_1380299 [Hesseltinella vesiculosa]